MILLDTPLFSLSFASRLPIWAPGLVKHFKLASAGHVVQNRFRAFSSTEHITVRPETVNSSSSSNPNNTRTVPPPKLPITMATPWDRISEDYRTWLLSTGNTAEDFNELGVKDRIQVRATFDGLHQRNGKLRCCRWLISYCCIPVCRRNTEMFGSWNTRIRMIPSIRFVYFLECL